VNGEVFEFEECEILSPWPLPRPTNWIKLVNQSQTEAEVIALRHCVNRGTPFGEQGWVATTADQLGLAATLRPRGRPKKTTNEP
jgi:putative transposase